MKKQNSILLTAALICLPLSGFANPTSPGSMDGIISAQVGVSKDNVQEFLREVMQNGGDQTFQHADFKRKVLKFSQDVDGAMQSFEAQMKNKVLAEISLYSENYNSVYNSTTYSSDEKTALLAQLYVQANSALGHSLDMYQSEVTKLIEVSGIHPLSFVAKTSEPSYHLIWVYALSEVDTTKSVTEFSDANLVSIDREVRAINEMRGTPPAPVDVILEDQGSDFEARSIQTFVYPQVTEGCYSSSCITLSLLMYTKYIKLIESSFLKDMHIRLADGKELVLKASGLKDKLTQNDLRLLSRVVLQKEAYDLPFDISEADLPKATSNPGRN